VLKELCSAVCQTAMSVRKQGGSVELAGRYFVLGQVKVCRLVRTISVVRPVCLRPSDRNISAPTGRIFMKFDT
jgi:hypothetical protein